MGRKVKEEVFSKKGPGRKARKQAVPSFKGFIESDSEEKPVKKLSRHQKERAQKRKLKQEQIETKAKKIKIVKNNDDSDDDLFVKKKEPKINGNLNKTKKLKQKVSFKSEISEEESEDEEEEDDDDEELEEEMDEENAEDEDVDEEEMDEDNEDEEDDDEEGESDEEDAFTRMEKQSKKLEKKKKQLEAEDAAANAEKDVAVEIPTLEEVKKELRENPDMQNISLRIKDIVFVLSKFNERKEEGRSRKEYLEVLKHDICSFYSYNSFLITKLMELFPLTELIDFLEANEVPRPVTLRTNTLKTRRKILAQALINQGVNLDVIPWSKVALVVYSAGSVPLGATSEYLCGHYILQGASSLLPVVALAPKENEKVLDMCAAPGGKSTHIAAMMRNTGIVFANDYNKDRTKALVGNFHRMGVSNSIITNIDGRKIPKMMARHFDRVLLDAPCSGTGVISKDEQVKMSKQISDIQRCAVLQKELILAAVDCVDANSPTGGFICYSTCSILVEENEEIINYILKKRKVQLVPTGIDIGKEAFVNFRGKKFHNSMKLCKRIYPHVNNMDGFFVAKLKKISNEFPSPSSNNVDEVETSPQKNIKEKKNKGNKENNNTKGIKEMHNKKGKREKRNKMK